MKPIRIVIDMDEVMADTYAKFNDLYTDRFGNRLTPEEYHGKKIYEMEGAMELRNHLNDPGFFRDLKVMPDAQEVVRELYDEYEVFIVTAATEFRHSFLDKYEWLEEHFPFIHWSRIVFCGDKSIVHGDYMIDDKVSNLEPFNGEGILFTASHNVNHDHFHRVHTWLDVREFFAARRRSRLAMEA